MRGGKRTGAGRPRGRRAITKAICMPQEVWDRLDARRGRLSRGKYVAAKI